MGWIFALLLLLVPLSAVADEQLRLETCDKLVALNDGRMLCWMPVGNDFMAGYNGVLYSNGRLSDASDGSYETRGIQEQLKIEKGRILLLADTIRLDNGKTSPETMIQFFDTYQDESQKVYFCDYVGSPGGQKLTGCYVPNDGNYKTAATAEFKVKGGKLWDGAYEPCIYERHSKNDWNKDAVSCEDRD